MKSLRPLALILAAALSTAALVTPAFANSDSMDAGTGGLTRAEVKAQLIQAEASGIIPAGKNEYPLDSSQIARNRMIYQASHPADAAQPRLNARCLQISGAAGSPVVAGALSYPANVAGGKEPAIKKDGA